MTIFPRHARLLANFPWNSELHMTSMSPIIRQKKCLIPHPTVMPGSSSVAWRFLLAMLKLFFGSRLLPYNLCNMVLGHGPEFTSLAAVCFHGTWCRREPHIDEIVSWKGYWGWAIYFMTWEYFGTHKLRIEVTTLLFTEPEGSKTFVTKLLHSIEGRIGTIKEVASLSVAFLRVLGLTTRYVSILDVAPLKP